ncbi:MAG: hypothetical protein Q9160_006506 [Pyrenula sp. 1 TL-2023]
MPEIRPRACDPCRLRKIRCNGGLPCEPCRKAEFECSFAKKPLKPGPKGPRAATSHRIKTQLTDIRLEGFQSLSSPKNHFLEHVSASQLHSFTVEGDHGFERIDNDLALISRYLHIYHDRLYFVWPIIDRTALLLQLKRRPQDPEIRALAFAICAATMAQLRIETNDSSDPFDNVTLCDRFAEEAEHCRLMFDYRESLTLPAVMISFFLHAFYSATKRKSSCTLLLREALTKAQILGLDRENTYIGLSSDEDRARRKVFWLLFITERGHAMQNENLPVILHDTISLPTTEEEQDPAVLTGFLSLVKLFVAVEGTLVGGKRFVENIEAPEREGFAKLQRQLQHETDLENEVNEVQTTDIRVTQQWYGEEMYLPLLRAMLTTIFLFTRMRILVWQLAVRNVLMTSEGDDPLSLTYPAHIARDSLQFLSRVSLDSLIAHGPGMVLKLFEIANCLLDVINCVPSLSVSPGNTMIEGPRDILHALSLLLSSLTSCTSQPLLLLQEKMARSNVPFPPVPRGLPDSVVKDESSDSGIVLSPPPETAAESTKRLDPQQQDFASLQSRPFAPSSRAMSSSGMPRPSFNEVDPRV